MKRKTLCESCAVVEQALESLAEQEVPAVFFGLGKEGQKNIAQLSGDVVCSEQLQSVGEIDHFGDRWRFFERVIAERERDPRHLPVKLLIDFGVRLAMISASRSGVGCSTRR